MEKDWYWFHADLTEVTRMLNDHTDFITYVHLLGWKSGIKPSEVKGGRNGT
jgi:hypothetical protein